MITLVFNTPFRVACPIESTFHKIREKFTRFTISTQKTISKYQKFQYLVLCGIITCSFPIKIYTLETARNMIGSGGKIPILKTCLEFFVFDCISRGIFLMFRMGFMSLFSLCNFLYYKQKINSLFGFTSWEWDLYGFCLFSIITILENFILEKLLVIRSNKYLNCVWECVSIHLARLAVIPLELLLIYHFSKKDFEWNSFNGLVTTCISNELLWRLFTSLITLEIGWMVLMK
jgi:hypothetical protein